MRQRPRRIGGRAATMTVSLLRTRRKKGVVQKHGWSRALQKALAPFPHGEYPSERRRVPRRWTPGLWTFLDPDDDGQPFAAA
jgi:hypothetical protein